MLAATGTLNTILYYVPLRVIYNLNIMKNYIFGKSLVPAAFLFGRGPGTVSLVQ